MGKFAVIAGLLAALGCAEEESNPDPMLVVARDGGGGGGVDAFVFEPEPDDGVDPPDPDRGVDPPDPDRGVDPDPDRGVDPPDPDMSVEPPLEGAVAAVTVVEQPDTAELSVAVTRLVEMPGQGDCQVVAVNPDNPPAPAQQLAAGPITVDGVSGGPYTFSLVGGSYQADRAVPDDLFGAGSTIRASAGGALPFDLQIGAPADVALQNPSAFDTLNASDDLLVRWNGTGAEAALITVFPVDFDGPVRGNWIFCGADDSGSFTIEGADLQRSAVGGIPGFPNALVAVTRIRTVSQDMGSNRAILTVTTSNGAPVILE